MSAVKQPVRGLSPSPQQFRLKSPLYQEREDSIHITPSVRKHRAACVRRLLCQSPTPGTANILPLEKQSNNSSGISVHITPCSPGYSSRSCEPDPICHLQKPSSDEFPKDLKSCKSPGGIPVSPSTLASLLSPASHRSPQDNIEKFIPSPLYTPDRKDVFLGRGSFGNVTLCHYKGHKFALKVVQNSSIADVGEKNLLDVRHDHLVRILHVAEMKDRVFICMEFAGRCNLQQLLDSKGYLDFKRRISFSYQVASGLSHCHKLWIIHRDVKPANVIVSPSGVCRLGDFGHSLKIERSPYAISPRCVLSPKGTVSYTAPEVLRGFLPSFASDIYSLGITLWQIQSREIPFAGEHPHVVIYKVVSSNMRPRFKDQDYSHDEQEFIKITESCWDANPDKRPEAQDIVQALLNLLNS